MSEGKFTKQDMENMIQKSLGESVEGIRSQFEAKQKEFVANLLAQKLDNGEKIVSPEKKMQSAGRYVRALAAARGNASQAADIAKRWGDDEVSKALGESTIAGGGAMVPDDMASSVVELWRNRTVVRKAGAMVLPMPSGNLSIPIESAGATASYAGEATAVNESSSTFGVISMNAKKLMVVTAISNELLRDASIQADAFVSNSIAQQGAVREDLAFIRGDGTSNTPMGLRYWADSVTATAGAASLATATTDMKVCLAALEAANVPMLSPAWVMSPRTRWYLQTLRDTNGLFVFKPEMDEGKLFGVPVYSTNQVPSTLGAGSNESELYLFDAASCLIGESGGMEIDAFPGGAYTNSSGTVVSGISTGQTVISMSVRHDFAPKHNGAEIAVITGVLY